jgi:ABC-type multidrug transport system fused ATPase/permease subunit
MMTQTMALLMDAYRELQAKKMFWIVLIINVVVILLFGMLGASENTITFLWYKSPDTPGALYLYKSIYSTGIVGIWFTWIAALLALISTAGIFPDFMSSGSIDLYLAKPIGRLRLFFTKYLAGLLFAALQVTVFSILSFFVLGIRAALWEPGIFLAIPLVLVFFSYLFGICTLLGVLTRSVMAALFLTLLAWTFIAGVDWVDNRVVEVRLSSENMMARVYDALDSIDADIKEAQAKGDAQKVADLQAQRAEVEAVRNRVEVSPVVVNFENVLYAIKTVMPKTRETTNMLDRYLFTDAEMKAAAQEEESRLPDPRAAQSQPRRGRGAARPASAVTSRLELERQRSVFWIIGTSLVFEALCLALAAWVFCTRDF